MLKYLTCDDGCDCKTMARSNVPLRTKREWSGGGRRLAAENRGRKSNKAQQSQMPEYYERMFNNPHRVPPHGAFCARCIRLGLRLRSMNSQRSNEMH